MVSLHFYGDSWTLEDDSENIIQDCVGYPSLVGKILDLPAHNHALSGNSQMGMIDQFVRTETSSGDHVIFSMSAPSRRFYFDNDGRSKNLSVDEHKDAINDFQDSWLSAITCLSLIHLCQRRGCHAWFINLFNISYQEEWAHPLWESIPSSVWLLEPDCCLVQKVFDAEWFDKFEVFRNSDFHAWLETENAQVQKYIRPCLNHPNLEGRNAIASFIANKLVKHLQ